MQNQQTEVIAVSPQKDAFLKVSAVPPPPGMQPRDVLASRLKGIPLSGGTQLEVNGLAGYTAVARDVGLPWGNRGPLRSAAIDCNGLTYLLDGGTRPGLGLRRAIRSCRRLRSVLVLLVMPFTSLPWMAPSIHIAGLLPAGPVALLVIVSAS